MCFKNAEFVLRFFNCWVSRIVIVALFVSASWVKGAVVSKRLNQLAALEVNPQAFEVDDFIAHLRESNALESALNGDDVTIGLLRRLLIKSSASPLLARAIGQELTRFYSAPWAGPILGEFLYLLKGKVKPDAVHDNVWVHNSYFSNPKGCEGAGCSKEKLFKHYYQQIDELGFANQMIPEFSPKQRLVSWNLHYFKRKMPFDSFHEIFESLSLMNADVFALQEVVYFPELNEIVSQYLGQDQKIYFCEAADWTVQDYGGPFGNMIISSLPVTGVENLDLGEFSNEGRCAQLVHFTPKGETPFSVANLHLDVFDKTGDQRAMQLQKFGSWLNRDQRSLETLVVGDFNALREPELGAARKALIKAADRERGIETPFQELTSFEGLGFAEGLQLFGVEAAKSTTWSNRRVDYLYVKEGTYVDLKGAYLYASPASDHKMFVFDFETLSLSLR